MTGHLIPLVWKQGDSHIFIYFTFGLFTGKERVYNASVENFYDCTVASFKLILKANRYGENSQAHCKA